MQYEDKYRHFKSGIIFDSLKINDFLRLYSGLACVVEYLTMIP